MLIDSHCHIDTVDLSPWGDSMDKFIAHTTESGVKHMLCVNIDAEHYQNVLALAETYDCVSASAGIHPNSDTGNVGIDVDTLLAQAQNPQVIAIGETGLDYFRSEGDLAWQHQRFRNHITVAKETGKPLIIHTRSAKEDTLKILREEGADSVGGVFHCFAEDWATAEAAMDLGFYISFSGIVTFKSAKELQDVASRVPSDKYLIETDSPYLAPVPKRGKPNYPEYVQHVAQKVADLRGVDYDLVLKQSSDNFQRLFNINL